MNAPLPMPPALMPAISAEAGAVPTSGILDVFNYGRLKPGLIPLWVGEGDLPTPAFICEAANRSLKDGETFYTYQRGIPALRESLTRYHERLFGRTFDPDRFFVTSGGMPAMMIAMRIAASAGDEVLIPTPAWPNFVGSVAMSGARPVSVPMHLGEGGWSLDFERLESAVTPRTRAIALNSPSNPTGWVASREELQSVFSFARRHGLWIVADEIYNRFIHDPALTVDGLRAPSIRDVAGEDDRILFVQTFSKNWSMTGWRLGWLEAPPALGQAIENLVQYSSSGTPVFVQRGGVAALEEGEAFMQGNIARARQGRAIVQRLAETGLVELPPPAGAYYAFLKVPGATNSQAIAMRLIDEANVGLSPGSAFGEAGEGFLRLCYARKAEDLEEAVRRIAAALSAGI